jgi:hypothetical protein
MHELIRRTAQVLYLFAPLLLSAALSGVVMRMNWLPALRKPLDAGKTWRGKRLFGDSKTWRGVFVAVFGCSVGAALQKHCLVAYTQSLALLDYARLDVLAFGTAMGAGAMLGELPNSFVKRRLDIAPGRTTRGWRSALFYVWDQVDLLTLSWPLLTRWVRPSVDRVLISMAIALLLHPITSLIGYAMGARKSAR